MIKFSNEPKLDRWFGEFGGGFCINDTGNLRYGTPEVDFLNAIKTDAFEENLRKTLKVVAPLIETKKVTLTNGCNVTIVPRLGIKYNLAGHVALALTMGKDKLFIGTYHKSVALDTLALAKAFGLKLQIVLGAKLSEDKELVALLKEYTPEVNDTFSAELFDMPHAYLLPPFKNPLPGMHMTDTANYNDYPSPALVGLLASIYGEDLKQQLGTDFDAVVAPTVEGTNALGLLKPFVNDDVDRISVEEVVCQEYCGIDHNCYTVIARRSDHDEMNLTLCPELVNYWRTAKVVRLGAARVKTVDLSICPCDCVNDLTKRAIALAEEYGNYKNMLVMEAE